VEAQWSSGRQHEPRKARKKLGPQWLTYNQISRPLTREPSTGQAPGSVAKNLSARGRRPLERSDQLAARAA